MERSPGNFIRAYRKRKQLTQAELATRMQISRSVVSRHETGEILPSLPDAFAYALALEQSVEELFSDLRYHVATERMLLSS